MYVVPLHVWVGLGQPRVIPLGDLAEKNVCQNVRRELEFRAHTSDVVRRDGCAQDRWDVENLEGSLGKLLVTHRAVGGAEIDRAALQLANPSAAAN